MKLKGLFSVTIAVASGLLVLIGYYFAYPTLLKNIRLALLNWTMIIAAFVLFLGVINLLFVHTNKIRKKEGGSIYSFILMIALITSLLIGLILGPEHQFMAWIFASVQLPVEASLVAVLVVTLTYASIRLLERRLNGFSILFLLTALLVLIGTASIPFVGELPVLGDIIRPFIAHVLASAGARGILIGVALGTLTTGLRILLGADRPYGGK